MLVTEAFLSPLNRRLEESQATPLDILRLAHRIFAPRLGILTSMQRSGTFLCRLAEREGLGLDVVFVDTGVLHQETRWTRDELARTHPCLRVVTLIPKRTFAAQTLEEGLLYQTREGQERCCELRKTEPLLAEKGRWDVLISALRKDEGGSRGNVRPLSLDVEMGALRVHPLANVTREELSAMIEAEPGVVINPLHAMGFPTIGCFPCTTPVLPDEPERAGRWRHLLTVQYCGINPVDRGVEPRGVEMKESRAEALRQAVMEE